MGRNANRVDGEGEGGGRRFTAAFRTAVQNRRAIFFPREETTRAGRTRARGERNAYIPLDVLRVAA